jgi:4-oxalocrotonate tautomerase
MFSFPLPADHYARHGLPPFPSPLKERFMPYVNIKITDEGVTKEQKAALIRGVTSLLQEVLNKNPATTVVVIDEVNTDNWGIKGEQVTELRKQAARS